MNAMQDKRIAVVVPAYRVSRQVLGVLGSIGPDVWRIFVVDDACPEGSGRLVQDQCRDQRVTVIFNEVNQGVGGAVMAGYRAAISAGADVKEADGRSRQSLRDCGMTLGNSATAG